MPICSYASGNPRERAAAEAGCRSQGQGSRLWLKSGCPLEGRARLLEAGIDQPHHRSGGWTSYASAACSVRLYGVPSRPALSTLTREQAVPDRALGDHVRDGSANRFYFRIKGTPKRIF